MPIVVERFPSAQDFLAAAEPFLMAAEVENNLILGIARRLASGPPADFTPYFATARRGNAIRMAAFRSIPIRAGITKATDPDAIEALAADVSSACDGLREVMGPEPTVAEFARAVAATRGTTSRRRLHHLMYELRRVLRPEGLPAGELRLAREADILLLTDWAAAFMKDVGDAGDAEHAVRSRIAQSQLYVWEDRVAVSMAAWSGQTPNGVRINFVFTPPAVRGRGYATASVAALSRLLLEQGNKYCCLYTDAANPTSNSIYQKIGYELLGEAGVYAIG